MKIDSFEGEYRFLSNFFMSPVEMDGKTFDSVEHAYQAAKSDDAEYRANFFFGITPGQAKKLGRTANLRADWEQVKIGIMTDLVRKKFNDKELASKLLATGDAELIEGNWWGDVFWGVCKGVGENNLGKILMQIRDELEQDQV